MAYELFTPLFSKIDQATRVFMGDISSHAITELTPVLTVGLTLSFIIYSFLIIQGLIAAPILQFFLKSLRIGMILSIALSGGIYQDHLAEFICTFPDDLACALITNPQQGDTAASLIDQATSKGFDRVSEAFAQASFFSRDGIIYMGFALIILATTVILISIGGSFLLLTKVALALLAGLGPLFIVALLFDTTKRFFDLWLAQIINHTMLMVLFAAIFGLMMDIFGHYMECLKLDGLQNTGYSLGGAGILAYAMIIILKQLPAIAATLSGGAGLNYQPTLNMVSTAGTLLGKGAQAGGKFIYDGIGGIATRIKNRRRSQTSKSSEEALPLPSENETFGYAKGSLAQEPS